MAISKETFLKNPFVELVNDTHPTEWVLLAVETNKEFRDALFSEIARCVRKGDELYYVGWQELLPKMKQELRDELYCYCFAVRDPMDWYESFESVVGPVSLNIKKQPPNNP